MKTTPTFNRFKVLGFSNGFTRISVISLVVIDRYQSSSILFMLSFLREWFFFMAGWKHKAHDIKALTCEPCLLPFAAPLGIKIGQNSRLQWWLWLTILKDTFTSRLNRHTWMHRYVQINIQAHTYIYIYIHVYINGEIDR